MTSGDRRCRPERQDFARADPPSPPGPEPFLPIEQDQTGSAVLLMLVVVLPLVFRRRYPLAVLWIVLAIAPSGERLRRRAEALVLRLRHRRLHRRRLQPVPGARAGEPAARGVRSTPSSRSRRCPTVPDDAVPFLILIPIAVAADGLRRWKRRADEGRARLSALEREQADALRRAAEHERARIARELHDVVTHNVSVMVIQAGAARKVMDANPDQAREALLAVEAGGPGGDGRAAPRHGAAHDGQRRPRPGRRRRT